MPRPHLLRRYKPSTTANSMVEGGCAVCRGVGGLINTQRLQKSSCNIGLRNSAGEYVVAYSRMCMRM